MASIYDLGAHTPISMFTIRKNNQFQRNLSVPKTDIYEYAPPELRN